MTGITHEYKQISFHGVSKSFRGRGEVVHDVNVTIPYGVVGLLGPNGAGKTTLMRLLCGIYRPSSGYLTYGENRIDGKKAITEFKARLGYLPQNISFSKQLTVLEALEYMCYVKKRKDLGSSPEYLHSLLDDVSLLDAKDQRAGSLSGGMTRRLGIAQALIGSPEILIVDEPTAGLDPEERMKFRRLLARFGTGRTVLLSTHILDDVSSACESIMFMHGGRVLRPTKLVDAVESASGHVWMTPPLQTLDGIDAEYHVVAEEPGVGGTRYRVVGDQPLKGFEAVPPSLDDVYLLTMKGLEQ